VTLSVGNMNLEPKEGANKWNMYFWQSWKILLV